MASATPDPSTSRSRASDTQHILVVDDDPGLNRLVAALLRSAGYEVTTADGGRRALELASTREFDAVVLDLLMPDLDGRGFFRELRALGNVTPVLIVSAYGARSAQQELGAEASMTKPFDPEALILVLQRLLEDQSG